MTRPKGFKDLVHRHIKTDKKYAEALLREGVDAMLSGDVDTGKTGRIISARKATAHERKAMKKETSKRLTREQRAELKSLAALPDSAIDTSDAPEVLDWSGATRGVFYRPVKQQLTLRLDADVVAWFKSHTRSNEGYQTGINRALREYVQGQAGRRQRSRV